VEGCREADFADFLGVGLGYMSVGVRSEAIKQCERRIWKGVGFGRTPLRAALAASEALALCLPVMGPEGKMCQPFNPTVSSLVS